MYEDIVHFIIGSSVMILIFPMLYLHGAYNRLSEEERATLHVSYPTLVLILPILSGFIFACTYRCLSMIPRKYNNIYIRFITTGIMTSLILSLMFHYVFHIQDKWLKMENPVSCHLFVPLFYAIVFWTIGIWVRALILYGPPEPSSKSITNSSTSPPTSAHACCGVFHCFNWNINSFFNGVEMQCFHHLIIYLLSHNEPQFINSMKIVGYWKHYSQCNLSNV